LPVSYRRGLALLVYYTGVLALLVYYTGVWGAGVSDRPGREAVSKAVVKQQRLKRLLHRSLGCWCFRQTGAAVKQQ
jgi:hypothetical protein